jgi:hypothetical protein
MSLIFLAYSSTFYSSYDKPNNPYGRRMANNWRTSSALCKARPQD